MRSGHSRAAARSAALLGLMSFVPTATAFAAPEGAEGSTNLLEPNAGLMVWTLVVFIGLMWVLKRYAFKPLFAAVEERERALAEAIDGARRDREASASLLA